MGLLIRGKVFVLASATAAGCLVTGIAWFAILWVVGALFGIGTDVFHAAAAVVTGLAVVAMLVFIWWLVVRFLPRMDRVVDRAAERLRDTVSLPGHHDAATSEAAIELDDEDVLTLAELDAALAPRPPADPAGINRRDRA